MRALRVVAVLVGALAASSCGGPPSGPAAGTFTPNEVGVLTIATSLPAPGFWEGTVDDPTGGFEYGLALELADRFGLADVRVVDVPFDRLVAGELGGADLALAEITPTAERRKALDFSTAYLDAHPGVLVRADADELLDLAGARELAWAVQAGSIHVAVVDDQIRPETEPLQLPDIESVVLAVLDGEVDAAVLDLPTALVAEHQSDGEVRVAAQFANDDVLAAALPEGSDDLDAVDSAIRAMHRDGTIERLADEWLGAAVAAGSVDVPLIRAQPLRP